MTSKQKIKDLIIELGDADFFNTLTQVVKEREINEWVQSKENFDDKAYKNFVKATSSCDLLAYWMATGNEESRKRA